MPSDPQDSPSRSTPPPIDLSDLSGLKFGPAWLTEAPPDLSKFEGRGGDDRGPRGDRFGGPRRDDRGGPRPPRRDGGGFGGPRPPRPENRGGPGGPRREGPPAGGGFRREGERGAPPRPQQGGGGPRPQQGGGPRPQGGGPRPGGGPGGPRDQRGGPPRGDQRGPQGGPRRDGPPPERRAERPPPLPVKIEFLPDPEVLLALAHQIRASHLAYPLFGLTRKFLEKPEYHRIRLTPVPPANGGGATPQLWRVGADGLITLDRQFAERVAFDRFSKDFYEETVDQGEPPKGNFSNVARCRLDGTLLGPTNHHSYQAALRGLWESRYARRMPFEAFRHYEIETVNDPAEVERWKEQSRTVKTWVVKNSEPPVALRSPEEVRRHFEQNHLPQIVQAVPDAEFSAAADREHGPDTPLSRAIRFEGEHEARHPLNLVQHVRTGLQRAGLQVFKHKKKVVYVSAVRPVPFRADSGSPVSSNIQAILDAVAAKPGLSRAELALAVIGAPPPTPEAPAAEVAATPVDDGPPADALGTSDTVSDLAPAPVSTESSSAGETTAPAETTAPETGVDDAPPAAEASPIAEDAPASAAEEAPAAEAMALHESADATERAVAPAVPQSPAEEAYAKAKGALVADLRWLLLSGHVIGFFDGTFDLPPSAKAPSPTAPAAAPATNVANEASAPAAESNEGEHSTEPPATEETVAMDQEPAPSAPEAPPAEAPAPAAPVDDPASALNVPVEGTEAKTEPHPVPSSDHPAGDGSEPPRHA